MCVRDNCWRSVICALDPISETKLYKKAYIISNKRACLSVSYILEATS